MAVNLFQELKDALQDFKDFLHPKVALIKDAINALALMVPQINTLLDQLIGLLGDLKEEIEKLDPSVIPHLEDVTTFTEKIKGTLLAAKNLLPEQAEAIDDVLGVTEVVTSLPSIDAVKQEIISLLDFLVTDLQSLKSTT